MRRTTGLSVLLLSVLFLSSLCDACVAAASITGRVTFSDDLSGVPKAVIQTDTGGYAVANSNGYYSISSATAGPTRVRAWAYGFRPSNVVIVDVPVSGTVTGNLVINKGLDYHTAATFTIYKTAVPPMIDGTVNTTTEWKDSDLIGPFYDTQDNQANTPQTIVRALYDDTNLYFAFDCIEPDMNGLVGHAMGRDDLNHDIYADDHVEIQIDPKHLHNGFDGTEGPPWYPEYNNLDGDEPGYLFAINCKEAPNTGWSDRSNRRTSLEDLTYNPAGIVTASRRGTGHWYVEISIPFTAFPGFTAAPPTGYVMGMQFGRGRPTSHSIPGMEWSGTDYVLWLYWMASQWNDVTFGGPRTVFTTPEGFVKGGRWNCIGVPADPVNPNPLTVFSAIDVVNSSFQYWKNHSDGGGYQSYGAIFGWTGPVMRGIPYWFLEPSVAVDKEVQFKGSIPTRDFELTIPAHTTPVYWVMFSTPFPNPIPANLLEFKNVAKRGDTWLSWVDAFSEANPNQRIVDSNALEWDPILNRFVIVLPDMFVGESHEIKPWYGYWLLVIDRNELKIRFPKL